MHAFDSATPCSSIASQTPIPPTPPLTSQHGKRLLTYKHSSTPSVDRWIEQAVDSELARNGLGTRTERSNPKEQCEEGGKGKCALSERLHARSSLFLSSRRRNRTYTVFYTLLYASHILGSFVATVENPSIADEGAVASVGLKWTFLALQPLVRTTSHTRLKAF